MHRYIVDKTPARIVNPAHIVVPPGYQVEAIATGLTYPTGVAVNDTTARGPASPGTVAPSTLPKEDRTRIRAARTLLAVPAVAATRAIRAVAGRNPQNCVMATDSVAWAALPSRPLFQTIKMPVGADEQRPS